MYYIIPYSFVLFDIFILTAILPSFLCWLIGYIVLFLSLKGRNPTDPRLWLCVGINILFLNAFTGIMYVPSYISYSKVIIYTLLTVIAFHLGFGKLPSNINKFKGFIFSRLSTKLQNITKLCGIIGIIGGILICFEMFIIFGVSIDDGGERRAQFQEMFPYMVLTPIGVILLGGSFISVFSIFCGGNKINQFLGIINILSIAVSSMAIAGKQGILFTIMIIIYVYSFKLFYKSKFNIPKYIKFSFLGIIYIFIAYLTFLTIGRQNITDDSNLIETSSFSEDFKNVSMKYVPTSVQNTFAEFFGYYGNQFPYIAERWDIEKFEEKYGFFRFPRILGPFTFLERQVKKIIPYYNEIYPDDRVLTIKNQTKGYYGNANWGTIVFLNIKYFGIIGGLIFFFFYGKLSKFIYNLYSKDLNFVTFQLNFINCASGFYFTMFYYTQETGPFFHLLILLLMYKFLKNNRKNEYRNCSSSL